MSDPEVSLVPDRLSLTIEQAHNAFREWLRIRAASGYAGQYPATDVEADHSALLNRLLRGRKALPTPPPLAYAYPWYELFDQPYVEWSDWNHSDPYIPQPPWSAMPSPSPAAVIHIHQAPWQIVRRDGPAFIVTHERTPEVYWRLWPVPYRQKDGTMVPGWRMEREPDD